MNHARWKLARERKIAEGYTESAETEAMRAEIRLAFDLGQLVYDSRTELALSQAELADRAGMSQPQISTIEGGGTVPTLPLLARLAKGLDASLNIAIDNGTSTFTITPHTGAAA
ncbi:XRE family transcriptional regulator [Streptomyces triticagri]|uniref:XRE family transcriptional regulator n=1 Tax=Streptomyces triticagri TaxID=2293568 RepID=A0A372LW53_9ACTN|nr:helix-turn-helix transcriptional regulator [Streptomyces triticagri]RFU82493.1 XRE family transcriptional regulator [Streptomyces triticagri]